MILKIFESDVIYRIGHFNFWLDDIELQSPAVLAVDDIDGIQDTSRCNLQVGSKAERNKISGLYVELEEDAKNRIKEPTSEGKYGMFKCTRSFYLDPGLEGIRKVIQYIKSLYNNQKDNLPSYLKDLKLRHFGFTSSVVWGMNKEWRTSKDGKIDYIDYEHDTFGGSSTASGIGLEFGNFGGDSFDIYTSEYYLDHLNAITKVLDEIAPGMYTAGPDEMEYFLEYEILKKEGRRLVSGDEGQLKQNIERYEADSFVRDLDENGEEMFKQKYIELKRKSESGEKLNYLEEMDLNHYKNLVDAMKTKHKKKL